MMKRRNVVMGVILASVLITAIVIQATFGVGVGGGVRVDPKEMPITPNATRTFTIILQSPQNDNFDVTIIPGTCDKSWFSWLENPWVRVVPREQKQLYLDVTPTTFGEFYFKVRAESSRGDPFESDYIWLISEPPPSPTPTTSPSPHKEPTCIGLEPNLPSPQKIMNENATKAIKWTAYACDPDGDTIWYRFWQVGPGGEEWTDWSTANEWTWLADSIDIGDNVIYVDVRDGYHHTDSTIPDYDSSCNRSYKIIAGEPPFCACLMPDKFSPQTILESITWTACVADNESAVDTFWYRYLVNGVVKREWSNANTWTWTPTTSGTHTITVMVRDNFFGSPLTKYPDTSDLEVTFKKYVITL
jgi:hypothetical protein